MALLVTVLYLKTLLLASSFSFIYILLIKRRYLSWIFVKWKGYISRLKFDFSIYYFSKGSLIITYIFSVFIPSVEKQLVEEVRKNDTLIIVGETGSGKTTRKLLYPCFW